jgi:hypothetical protein
MLAETLTGGFKLACDGTRMPAIIVDQQTSYVTFNV